MNRERAHLVEVGCWFGLILSMLISAAFDMPPTLAEVLILIVWGAFLYYRIGRELQ